MLAKGQYELGPRFKKWSDDGYRQQNLLKLHTGREKQVSCLLGFGLGNQNWSWNWQVLQDIETQVLERGAEFVGHV